MPAQSNSCSCGQVPRMEVAVLVAPAKALGRGVFLLVLMGAGGGRVVPNASAAAAAPTACTAGGQYTAQARD